MQLGILHLCNMYTKHVYMSYSGTYKYEWWTESWWQSFRFVAFHCMNLVIGLQSSRLRHKWKTFILLKRRESTPKHSYFRQLLIQATATMSSLHPLPPYSSVSHEVLSFLKLQLRERERERERGFQRTSTSWSCVVERGNFTFWPRSWFTPMDTSHITKIHELQDLDHV